MGAKLSFRRVLATGLVVGSMSVGLMAVTASGAATQPKASGTLTFAEGPGANPNYIFPYMGCKYFSVDNINQFESLMYRPLYWFGLGPSSAVQYPLSLAAPPIEASNHRTITINLKGAGTKGWKFSNGQRINAESVAFFLNMYKANPGSYCGYNAGYGIPDKLGSVTYPGGLGGNQVVLHFTVGVNPYWILYNYLSEITPFPQAWDKTSTGGAAGSGGCATAAYGSGAAATHCKAVQTFLDAQSGNTSTYTDAMWQTVDGPWRLHAFDVLGNADFVPNTRYGGPQKALLAHVKEKQYNTVLAEQNDLYANSIQLGYVDPSILPNDAPAPGRTGSNVPALNAHYILTTGSPWSFNYAPFNLAATDPKHAALNQLYIREALQGAVNQLAIIKKVDKGYGWPTCSPLPPNTPASISGKVACAYAPSATKYKNLLTNHGWKIQGGVQTCTRTGTSSSQCGAGIGLGYKLNFQMIWASGSAALDTTVATEFAEWNSIGIKFTGRHDSFNTVISECNGGTFQICWWGGGWIYAPDYYPSGETLFTPAGSFDVGSYNNATMTALIDQTTTGSAKLTAYAKFASQQLPVLYEPNPTATGEVQRTVKCVNGTACKPDPLQNFMPEYMHY